MKTNLRTLVPAIVLGLSVTCGAHSNAFAQTAVDFREAIRTIEPAILTVDVSAKDNVEAAQEAEEPVRKKGPRIEWLNPNGQVNGNAFQRRMMRNQRLGAGDVTSAAFAVQEDLVICYIGGPADAVTVKSADGKTYRGTVVARDNVTGLAAVEVDDVSLDSLIVSAADAEAGMPVVASWLKGETLTSDGGMIASRSYASDTGVGPAPDVDFGGTGQMKGAPVVNATGIVVGVLVPSKSSRMVCAPAKAVMRLIESATDDEPVDLKRGLVGIQFQGSGTMITDVSSESGAAQAGLKSGDLVEQVDGMEVRTATEVISVVAGARAGDTLEMMIRRDGDVVMIPVTLTEHPRQFVAQSGGFNRFEQFPNGFAMQRAWKLEDDELVPMDVDPNGAFPEFPMNDLNMDEIMKKFAAPMPNMPQGFGGAVGGGQFFGNPPVPPQVQGFQIERSDVEESLQDLKEQMKELSRKLDNVN